MCKDVYVFAEQRDGNLQKVGIELIGEARKLADDLGQNVVAVLLGNQIKDKASELIALDNPDGGLGAIFGDLAVIEVGGDQLGQLGIKPQTEQERQQSCHPQEYHIFAHHVLSPSLRDVTQVRISSMTEVLIS